MMRTGLALFLSIALLCLPVAHLAGQESITPEARLGAARRVLEEDYIVTADDILELQALYDDIAASDQERLFPEIRMLLFIAGEKYTGEGFSDDGEVGTAEGKGVQPGVSTKSSSGFGIAVTTSAVSAGLFNLFWLLGDSYHDRYATAATAVEAAELLPYWQVFDLLTFISAGVSLVSFGIALPLLVSQPIEFAVPEIEGGSVQQQVEYLLTARGSGLRKRSRADTVSYSATPRALLGTGVTLILTEILLFTMGTIVYNWNVPDRDNDDMDPVSFSGIVIGLSGSAFIISSLVAALLNPRPSTLEMGIARNGLELEKRNYNTTNFVEEDRTRLEAREMVLLEKLDKETARKRWNTPLLISAAGAGVLSLAGMGTMLYFREKAEETIRSGGTPSGFVPSDGLIIGTGTAGGVLLSAAGFLLVFAPKLERIQDELDYIGRKLNRVE